MADRPNHVANPNNKAITLVQADSTNLKDVITGETGGTKVLMLSAAANGGPNNNEIQLWWNDGTNDFLIGSHSLPSDAGFDGSKPSVDLLDGDLIPGLEIDESGNRFLRLDENATLRVMVTTAMGVAPDVVYISAFTGDF